MADATLGVAVLRTRLDASGLKTGLNQARNETTKATGDMTGAIRGIGAAFGAIAASAGVRSYVSFLTSSANLAHQADAANRLFEKSLQRTNQSLGDGAALVSRLADRFGVANSVIEESATLMLRQGASLDDVERALTAAGASAAAAGFDISTAFGNVATAVATGRSELLETSGIVANLGPVAQQYARSVGKTVEELTQQELIQARVNAIYRETASEIEDVDEILQGLPRSQANVTREFRTFREDVGRMAQEVIVPLTDGLGTVLRYVNDLPEPVKRAGTAMAGAAIGATALATGIVAIRTALTGLQALGMASFGPAGWIVLGVTAVAGLVAVLSGRPDSLDKAVQNASDALAGGDKDTLVAALDEVIAQVNGPTKTAFEELRGELIETGDVGVEQAQRIANALALIEELRAAQERVAAAQEALTVNMAASRSMREGGVSRDASGNVMFDVENELEGIKNQLFALGEAAVAPFIRFDQELGRFVNTAPQEVLESVLDPEGVQAVLDRASRAVAGAMTGTSGMVNEARSELEAAQAELDAVLAKINAPVSSGGGGGGGDAPPTTGKNKVAERVNALDLELAALRGELDHGLITAEEFFQRSGDAVRATARDLLRMNASQELVTATLDRLQEFSLGELFEKWEDHLEDEVGRFLARQAGVGMSTGQATPALRSFTVGDVEELNLMRRRAEDYERQIAEGINLLYSDSDGELARMRARARDYSDQLDRATDAFDRIYGDSAGELARFHSNMAFGAKALRDAAFEAARLTRAMNLAAEADAAWAAELEGIDQRQQDIAAETIRRENRMARINRLFDAASGSGDAQAIQGVLDEIERFGRDFGSAWGEMFAAHERTLRQQLEAIDIVNNLARAKAEEVAAYRYSGENAQKYTDQLVLQGEAAALAAREGISLTEALQRLMGTLRLTAEQAEFGVRVGSLSRDLGRRREREEERDSGGLAEARRIIQEQERAADRFASTVISAGFSFGEAAIKAIQDGDLGGVIRAGLSGAGSIFSAAQFDPISFLGGSINPGILIAGGLGILGTLLGALFSGGGRNDADRAAAEARRVGNVPAINLNFTVNQTNTYNGAPSQPENEQAFRRQANVLFEELYRRHLGPRLDRIEQRLGIAGAPA